MDGKAERVETNQDSHPKVVEAGENSDSEISKRENQPSEPRLDGVKPESRAKEQGIQQTLEWGNAESVDREPKVEDNRGVNEHPSDIEMMRAPHETANTGKEATEPSDRGAVENVQERLTAREDGTEGGRRRFSAGGPAVSPRTEASGDRGFVGYGRETDSGSV